MCNLRDVGSGRIRLVSLALELRIAPYNWRDDNPHLLLAIFLVIFISVSVSFAFPAYIGLT